MKQLLLPLFIFLYFCVTVHSQGFAGIFAILRHQNSKCYSPSNETGTCLSIPECTRRAGIKIGDCANGNGACCSFKFTCGGSTNQNKTEFVNKNHPRGENGTETCQVTISKQDDVCQLRLDFEEFVLAQPDEHGLCTTDSFMVRTTVGERLPILCGDNAGQHMYIDMGRGSGNPVVLSVVSNGNRMVRKWKIKINMIPCNNLDMAPSGCMQFYRSPSAVVKSFNYGPKIENRARYLANQRYTTCIRVEENFCAIKWEAETPNSFAIGAPFEKTTEYGNVTEPSSGAGEECSADDYVGIDQGSYEGVTSGHDRFCGNSLLQTNTVTSRAKPFALKIRTNADHSLNAANSQQGFSLRYTQLPCVV